MLPTWNEKPPFRLTRASHVVLTTRDLAASRDFYVDAIGLVLTEAYEDALYFRGLEEAAHHSLVVRRSDGPPTCDRIGFRVENDDEIHRAIEHLQSVGIHTQLVDRYAQGLTLHFDDPLGVPMELVASMDLAERRMQRYHEYGGGSPQRLDHFQVVSSDVQRSTDFWSDIGFRLTEYTAQDGTDELWGSWLEVKGNTHDLVFTNGKGPRLHHFAYTVPDSTSLLHAADVSGSLGYADAIDRGPGRHGISNAMFLYLRDPDGHRIELFNTHYQFIDRELEPMRWNISDPRRAQLWGLPASERWFFEATGFPGKPVVDPLLKATPVTLEWYLSLH